MSDNEKLVALAYLTTRDVILVLDAHGIPRGAPEVYEAIRRKVYASLKNARLMGRLRPDGERDTRQETTMSSDAAVMNAIDPGFDQAPTKPGFPGGPKRTPYGYQKDTKS